MPRVTLPTDLPVEEASISATVIRCGCGDTMAHAARQLPCPTPIAVEDLGHVAYYHRNPLRRLAWAARQGWREGRQ